MWEVFLVGGLLLFFFFLWLLFYPFLQSMSQLSFAFPWSSQCSSRLPWKATLWKRVSLEEWGRIALTYYLSEFFSRMVVVISFSSALGTYGFSFIFSNHSMFASPLHHCSSGADPGKSSLMEYEKSVTNTPDHQFQKSVSGNAVGSRKRVLLLDSLWVKQEIPIHEDLKACNSEPGSFFLFIWFSCCRQERVQIISFHFVFLSLFSLLLQKTQKRTLHVIFT